MIVGCYRKLCVDPACEGPHRRPGDPPGRRRVGPIYAGPPIGPLPAREYVLDWWERADLCRCGSPSVALETVRDALAVHPPGGVPDPHGWDELNARRREWLNGDGHLLIAMMLEVWGLTDHGTSVYSGWLTVDGRALQAAIGACGDDLWDVFHDEGDRRW